MPFGVALMSEVPDAGLVAMEVPEHDAADSWFTDYAWRRVLYCATGAAGRPLHLGWVYERKAGAVGPGPAQFVALIVRPEQEVERRAENQNRYEIRRRRADVRGDQTARRLFFRRIRPRRLVRLFVFVRET